MGSNVPEFADEYDVEPEKCTPLSIDGTSDLFSGFDDDDLLLVPFSGCLMADLGNNVGAPCISG